MYRTCENTRLQIAIQVMTNKEMLRLHWLGICVRHLGIGRPTAGICCERDAKYKSEFAITNFAQMK
jgi:hypothetical protein